MSDERARKAAEEIRQLCIQQAGYLNATLTAEIIERYYRAATPAESTPPTQNAQQFWMTNYRVGNEPIAKDMPSIWSFADDYARFVARAATKTETCPTETVEISLCHEAANIITNACQIIDVTKVEWGAAWSEWDQSVRDAASSWLERFHGHSPAPAPQKEPK